MSEQVDPGAAPASVRGIAGLLVANSSLLVAGLVYMGWAYTDALWGYFHLDPLDLGVGVFEYVLRSLSLFSPVIVFAVVVFIAVTAIRAWDLDMAKLRLRAAKVMCRYSTDRFTWVASSAAARQQRTRRRLLIITGMAVSLAGLTLMWLAYRFSFSTYLVLGLLGAGPLILTRPTRSHRHGRILYALSLIVAGVCVLWAGSLYAHNLGLQAAEKMVRGLPAGTAVAVYSTQRLALDGPGVTVGNLGSTFQYHYRYEGLRLLTARSGTYYLLPAGWTPQLNITYIVNDSDQIRIELYSGEQTVN